MTASELPRPYRYRFTSARGRRNARHGCCCCCSTFSCAPPLRLIFHPLPRWVSSAAAPRSALYTRKSSRRRPSLHLRSFRDRLLCARLLGFLSLTSVCECMYARIPRSLGDQPDAEARVQHFSRGRPEISALSRRISPSCGVRARIHTHTRARLCGLPKKNKGGELNTASGSCCCCCNRPR